MNAVVSHETADLKREIGMGRAVMRADKETGGWADLAYGKVVEFASRNREFLTEDLRACLDDYFPHPQDGRAWGSVMRRAARNKIIRRKGYAPARSSNLSPKPLWESLLV